jgi:hypothetical protein
MSEFQALDANGKPIGNVLTPDVTTKASLSGSSSQVFTNSLDIPVVVRILSEGGYSHYLIGTNPTATTSHTPLPGDVAEQIQIPGGEKIAFIGSVPVYVTTYRKA